MAKEFFKDLPNTTTPLTASRLNGLLDGDEALGNIVVDSIRLKNYVNNRNYFSDNSAGIYSTTTTGIRATTTNTNQNQWGNYELPLDLLGKTCTFSADISVSNSNVQPAIRIYYGAPTNTSIQNAGFDLTTTGSRQATNTFLSELPSGCTGIYMLVYANRGGSGFSTGAYSEYSNIQLEEGSTKTTYSPYFNISNSNHWIARGQVQATITNGSGTIQIVPYLLSDGTKLKIVQGDSTTLNSYTTNQTTTLTFNVGITPKHQGRSQCLFKDFTNNNATNMQSCPVIYNTDGTITITCFHNNTGSNGRFWLIGDIEFYLD